MGKYQALARHVYGKRGYSDDLRILALGLNEEAGEVAAAVLDRSKEFKPKPNRVKSDLEHELRDCLFYLCAIANAADIDLDI